MRQSAEGRSSPKKWNSPSSKNLLECLAVTLVQTQLEVLWTEQFIRRKQHWKVIAPLKNWITPFLLLHITDHPLGPYTQPPSIPLLGDLGFSLGSNTSSMIWGFLQPSVHQTIFFSQMHEYFLFSTLIQPIMKRVWHWIFSPKMFGFCINVIRSSDAMISLD